MHNCDITLRNISKIEGHTHLDVVIRNKKVKSVKLKIAENRRFYIKAIEGRGFDTIPQTVSRMCGTCSPAHQLCAIEAIEKAFGVVPTEQTLRMRHLLMNGTMIRDHAMHLYFFSLPDYVGKDSVLDFGEDEHKLIHDALDLKTVGNDLCKTIGGRSVHPMFPVVGGFSHFPSAKDVLDVRRKLKLFRNSVIDILELFFDSKLSFKRKTNYVGLKTDNFTFLDGNICDTDGLCVPENGYEEHFDKIVVPYSQSDLFEVDGHEFMVGSLARLNLNKDALHAETKKTVDRYLKLFPSDCIFNNNIAQAIEIMHCIDQSLDMLTEFKRENVVPVEHKTGTGVGVLEAPRGTLYYKLKFNDGKLSQGNVVIPTSQNALNMQKDIKSFVQHHIDMDKLDIERKIEQLIRAYDPCMSCATHFLKVKWS